jgi:hypothetical protein
MGSCPLQETVLPAVYTLFVLLCGAMSAIRGPFGCETSATMTIPDGHAGLDSLLEWPNQSLVWTASLAIVP